MLLAMEKSKERTTKRRVTQLTISEQQAPFKFWVIESGCLKIMILPSSVQAQAQLEADLALFVI